MRSEEKVLQENLYDVLAQAAHQYGDRTFMVMGKHEDSVSFQDLALRADQFGRFLVNQGVRPGDRVLLWMTNQVDWAVAAYGVARAGAVLVAMNTRLTVREVAHMLTLTRPVLWVMEDVFLGKINAAEMINPVLDELRGNQTPLPELVVRSSLGKRYAGALDWHEAIESALSLPELPPASYLVGRTAEAEFPELNGAAVIISTSGTTAAPKGVVLGHRGLIRLAEAVGQRQAITPKDKFYSIAPFFHCSGYMHAILVGLIRGCTLFSTARYQFEETMDVIKREQITLYHGSILPLREMAAHSGVMPEDLRSFDRAWYSAPAAEMAYLEGKLGVRQCEVYGLTETGGNVAICHPSDPVVMRHDSDGQPHEGLEVKFTDPETGKEVPDGTPGEILVRGWNVMQGYFRDSEATAKTIDADGWLHTGDQGVRLPGGFIKFLCRLKHSIRVGGENLSPMEVEEVLLGHPAVAEVAVVGAPHERLGEVPVAFVIPSVGIRPDPADLDSFCRKHLANFKIPTRYVFVDDFPRTVATSRVQKHLLQEMLRSETASVDSKSPSMIAVSTPDAGALAVSLAPEPVPAPSFIELSGITKVYHSRENRQVDALLPINLSIRKGEFLSIVGPSGCGKTTLLMIAAGLIAPTAGTVRINSQVMDGPSRECGVVFQRPVLLPWSRIIDNVMLPVEVMGLRPREEYAQRAKELLALVGLKGFEHAYPNELSGGMQQRAAIVRALVYESSVLLMDEPFGALDALTREEMNLELLRIWQLTGRSIIFVTHSIPEAVLLSDRVVVMSARPGQVKAVIPIDLKRPRELSLMGKRRYGQLTEQIRSLLGEKTAASG